MDGVIVDFLSGLCAHFGVDQDKISTYKIEEELPAKAAEIRDYYGAPGFFSNLEPYPGAIEFLVGLRSRLRPEDKMWFVSKPATFSPVTWSDKAVWILKHVPWMIDTTILTPDKSTCSMDVFIDDDVNNLLDNPSAKKILFARSWNRSARGRFVRVFDYDELMRIVLE